MKDDSFFKKLFGSEGAKKAQANIEAAKAEQQKKAEKDHDLASAYYDVSGLSPEEAQAQQQEKLDDVRAKLDQAFSAEAQPQPQDVPAPKSKILRGTEQYDLGGSSVEVGAPTRKLTYYDQAQRAKEKRDDAA